MHQLHQYPQLVDNMVNHVLYAFQDSFDGLLNPRCSLIERHIRHDREANIRVLLGHGRDYCALFHRAFCDEHFVNGTEWQWAAPESTSGGGSEQIEVAVLVDIS